MRRGQVPTFTQIGGGVALEGCGRNASVTLQKIKLQSVSRQSRRADTNWVTDLGQDQIIFSSPPPTNEPLIGWREWRQIFYIFVTTIHAKVGSVEFSSSMVFSPRGDMGPHSSLLMSLVTGGQVAQICVTPAQGSLTWTGVAEMWREAEGGWIATKRPRERERKRGHDIRN